MENIDVGIGCKVPTIHKIFKEAWKTLHVDTENMSSNTKKRSSDGIGEDDFKDSFFNVDELKILDRNESIDIAIQFAAEKWEKLDLSYGINRRKKKGVRQDYRATKLPQDGFDIYQPMDNELYKQAVQSKLLNIGSVNDGSESDDDDEMISLVDNVQYKQRLSDIFKSVPSYLHSLDDDDSSTKSPLQLENVKKMLDNSSLPAVKSKRSHSSLTNDIFYQLKKKKSPLTKINNEIGRTDTELINDRLLFDINVYSTSHKVFNIKKKNSSNKSNHEDDEDVEEDEDESVSTNGKTISSQKRRVHTQSVTVYSDTSLTQFIKAIRCPCENLYHNNENININGEHSEQNQVRKSALVIGNYAYITDDYSDDSLFIKFLEARVKQKQDLSSISLSRGLEVVSIQGVVFNDIKIKLNDICLFYHDDDCLHEFMISDIKLQFIPFERIEASKEVDNHNNEPLQTSLNVAKKPLCMGCKITKAAYVTYHDTLANENKEGCLNAMYFCEVCHFALHYTDEGELLEAYRHNESFRIFPCLPSGF